MNITVCQVEQSGALGMFGPFIFRITLNKLLLLKFNAAIWAILIILTYLAITFTTAQFSIS